MTSIPIKKPFEWLEFICMNFSLWLASKKATFFLPQKQLRNQPIGKFHDQLQSAFLCVDCVTSNNLAYWKKSGEHCEIFNHVFYT